MKTSAKAVLILVFLTISSEIFALDTASARYFPLKVGNSWTYHYKSQFFQTYKYRIKITADSIINDKKYFHITGFSLYSWIRYDSLTSNLIAYTSSANCSNYQNHAIIDSLGSALNSTIYCSVLSYTSQKCVALGNQTIFAVEKQYKEFFHDGLTTEKIKYVKDFGIVSMCWGEPVPCVDVAELTGCVLDGIVYGDTTLTSIQQIGNIIPDKFELKQNYPNPFNPSTNIQFTVPKSGFVNLKVYDVNGKEIATLINENLQAGEYKTIFNAIDLSSGIYFYTLKAGDYTETKRMVLIK